MNRLEMEKFDIVALTKEIAEQAEMEADKKGIRISIKGADNLPRRFGCWPTNITSVRSS